MKLFKYEKKKYSQNGEDGILAKLIADISPDIKKSLEFGVQGGVECNTRLLRDNGWEATMFDSGFSKPNDRLFKEFISENNINDLITKYNCSDISVLSIDIDGQDFYVWNAIEISPAIVIIEYNRRIPYTHDYVMPRDPAYCGGPTKDYSCGVGGLFKLGTKKGYSLVGSCSNGVNLFFVRNDMVDRLSDDIRSEINSPNLVSQIDSFDVSKYVSSSEFLEAV